MQGREWYLALETWPALPSMLAPVPYGVDDINDAAAVHNPVSTTAISRPIELDHERTPSSRCELPAQGDWDGIDTNLELDVVR